MSSCCTLLSDDPPEYNVKERLKELNAELAMEPDPDDREHRVGFKQELVDLVAPPPEVSDEEDSARKTPTDDGDKEKADGKGQGGGDKKKQFVVERDGKFDVVADHELTSSERAMFNIPHEEGKKSKTDANDNQIRTGGGDNRDNMNNSNSWSNKENMHPMPPAKPRPNTANGYSRRNVRPAQSPRPQTATSSHYVSRSNTLQNFNHVSQYAMSPSEKERALERARYVCVWVHAYVCVCVWVHGCVYVYVYVCIGVCVCVCVLIVHVCGCVRACRCVRACVHL